MQSNLDSIEKKLEILKSITPPKIAITKTTFLTPIEKPELQKQHQKTKPHLYTTVTAKITETTRNSTSAVNTISLPLQGTKTKEIGKVALRDLKDIIKPFGKSIASPAVSTSPKASGSSKEAVNYNMAIVAAKRPHLTIVASKTVVDSSTATPASSTAGVMYLSTTTESSTTATAETSTESGKMEHSYIREHNPKPIGIEIKNGLTPARNILLRRPPQCQSCHSHPSDEQDLNDMNQAPIPSYNEISAKEAMNECARIAKYVKNNNADDEDWEMKINQMGWSNMQKTLFSKVVRILDNDQLGRLAHCSRPNEAMQRRVIVDKSAARMRKALASVAWESRLTQWLHSLLMDCLPATYMASYLDILQTLKSKLPTLMDKMLFGRPLNISQELLAPVLKKKWEPQIAIKSRNLSQNAVIVALPSMPTGGPVPNRLQKWYQHLATITQIVQVTLPMTSGHISRQPLEQVAEQIVSLTRVKIHELRSENSQRSIILIGFNAGASLALQVGMSENVACVVCMGFAYNTYNGIRGTPDDRILDIKVPILFVIGQNSARSSPEEIECLREKMQSESSLVVVGSADDALRVPKSRRKIENVTQSMVDTMVVDEVYDFIKKILANPPGPRIPTSVSNNIYNKLSKASSGEKTPTGPQRKRKQEVTDAEGTPAKTKPLVKKSMHESNPITQDPFIVKRKVGRPRTRPMPNAATATPTGKLSQIHTSTPVIIGKGQVKVNKMTTNDDLNMAMQSIMSDTNDGDSSLNTSTTSTDSNSQKLVSNFELIAQSGKTTPLKTTLMNAPQKPLIIGGSSSTAVGTKIKMIPSNQFVQIKPTTLQSQSKIYTIKPGSVLGQNQGEILGGPRIGSIVTTSPSSTTGQHIFTLKTPNGQTTQFATAVGNQPKYTVLKNSTGKPTLQLSATAKTLHPIASTSGAATSSSSASSNLDLSNIIDMPIIFADNEGNLSEGMDSNKATSAGASTSGIKTASKGVGQLIISQKIIKEANTPPTITSGTSGTYVINKPGTIIQSPQLGNKPNKVVFINRNSMKPCPNIISRTSLTPQLPKYTKVVVTNSKLSSSPTIIPRVGSSITTTSPQASTVKKINIQPFSSSSASSITTRTAGGILNVPTKNLPQIQIINNPNASLIASDKPQIRNIVVKPGGLKQIPSHLTSQLLNRNLTVRKLVNLVPATKSSPTAIGGGVSVATASTTSDGVIPNSDTSPSATIQSSPKIITLNPLNRTTTIPTSTTTTKSE
ncbi:KAT8 regulatory NSL complex subunit 3 isoform X2 [Stomoxys calcitrans]|uniref:KAT8 regulatory NSL complex subunit 3 isoform X2 n=1 Tax=Stomoxys calcitrans TaxID=35570 RepID=UPI0027E2F868|nr:KAT8 regulatory NSL complex subunit 3 isoform X2 [Stomoxys calcitrans]